MLLPLVQAQAIGRAPSDELLSTDSVSYEVYVVGNGEALCQVVSN